MERNLVYRVIEGLWKIVKKKIIFMYYILRIFGFRLYSF